MPIRFSAFGRVFAPSWPLTLIAAVLLVAFVALGRWQWQRGEGKQAVWAEFERNPAAIPVSAAELEHAERFVRVELGGKFDTAHQFLLDNRSHAGKPGFEVLTPFETTEGARLLVNRGWVPFSGYRDQLPDVSFEGDAPRRISGRIEDLPAAGLPSGRSPPALTGSWPRLTSFPTQAELEQSLGAGLLPRLLLLDPALPDGYVREWSPPGLSPDRHFSYAIQWWGFAVVLLVIYFGLNFRKVT